MRTECGVEIITEKLYSSLRNLIADRQESIQSNVLGSIKKFNTNNPIPLANI